VTVDDDVVDERQFFVETTAQRLRHARHLAVNDSDAVFKASRSLEANFVYDKRNASRHIARNFKGGATILSRQLFGGRTQPRHPPHTITPKLERLVWITPCRGHYEVGYEVVQKLELFTMPNLNDKAS